MQSICLINSSQIFHPFSVASKTCGSKGRKLSSVIMASMRDQNFSGRLVDESMIILRKRIHEMNMIERNYEPPSDWMDWEKRYYTSYDSIICEAVGVLQTHLMNTRPSLALGAMALVAISVPTSTAVLFFHLVDLAKALSSLN
ncbi:uncharacterized protein LOC109795207 [Cajanus cajan]|uniref:Mediator of RNA polymerase II transcription subunit 18 n=1 Tax=Cajanus cajan TaxID=3821 RepID=A0A151U7S2_CAJCA|nr:uncharacterized protein LOC109795207 [Cajanus cajan]KYP75365.1 hypothetical protein KK1_008091 [Cajanus cajan]